MCDTCKMAGGAMQAGGAALAPLSYLNPSYREPSSSAGPNALYSEPGLARPSMNATGGSRNRNARRYAKSKCTRKHKHTRKCKATSRKTSRKGGFFPPVSVAGPFYSSAPTLAPAAFVSGYRMLRNYKSKTRKN